MDKIAYKEQIYKVAKVKKYVLDRTDTDPIFRGAFDYANEHLGPNATEEQFQDGINKLYHAEKEILDHKDIRKAVREQKLPYEINRSKKVSKGIGAVGGAIAGAIAASKLKGKTKIPGAAIVTVGSYLTGKAIGNHVAHKKEDELGSIKGTTERINKELRDKFHNTKKEDLKGYKGLVDDLIITRRVDALNNNKKTASDVIDNLYKLASDDYYLNPIVCEVCNYEGKPEYDGRCPRCGAVGGIKPRDPASDKVDEGLMDNSLRTLNFDMMIQDGDGDLSIW